MNQNNIKPSDIQFTHLVRMSKAEFNRDPELFTKMVDRDMREALMQQVQSARVEKKFGEHYVEARLEVYVATPEQFWKIVDAEAEKIAMRFKCL